MAKTLLIPVVSALCLTALIALADDEPKKKTTPASVGMKIKLDLAKEILGGLSTGDFEVIEENGKGMQGLNVVEYFARGKAPEYQTQLKTFQFATNELVRHAQDGNLDGATLAYTQMTISCVSCHKQLRESGSPTD